MNKTKIFSVFMCMMCTKLLWASVAHFDSSNPEIIMSFIQGNSAFIYLSAFFGLGLLLAFTPCVLPMVPILSGIIIGQKTMSASKAFRVSLSYVLGMSVTYALAGMLAGYMGSTIQTLMQRPLIIIGFSCLFLLMALSMFGFFDIRVPAKWSNKINGAGVFNSRKNYLSIGLMGVASTLIVSPCVTAPLIGVLSYIGQNGNVAMGGLILFVMSLGMGIPLLLVGLGYGSILPKTGAWMLIIKQFFGFVMLAMAIWMLSRVVDDIWINVLWAVLFVVVGICLVHLTAVNKTGLITQYVGFLALICSGVFIHKAFIAGDIHQEVSTKSPFENLSSLNAINQRLEQAKGENKRVMIEFFATWCSDCQAMESKVFNQPEMINKLSRFVTLKVDISQKTPEVEQIRKAFGVYGFPTILFFDSEGSELKQLTSVGFISLDSMLALLVKVKR
jgi:thiol:disulfide interchange protein DsbD